MKAAAVEQVMLRQAEELHRQSFAVLAVPPAHLAGEFRRSAYESLGATENGVVFSRDVDRIEFVHRKLDQMSAPLVRPREPRRSFARDFSTALAPLLAACAALAVWLWSVLMAASVAARQRFVEWVEAPARAEEARREELAAIYAGAAAQAEYAEQNGMLLSAQVWREIAEWSREDEHP